MIVTTIMISASADAPRATFVNATTITIRDSKVDSRVTKKIDKIPGERLFQFEGMQLRPIRGGS
jgi:hypothetical protein